MDHELKLPPVPPVAIHIQPLSGLGQTGLPVFILSYRVSQKMSHPR
jgi:hypothetical protein